MTTLEVVLQLVVFFLLMYLWYLAYFLAIKMFFDIPGSAFSRNKQRKRNREEAAHE